MTFSGVDHFLFKVDILSNEDREWHESFSLVLGPDDPVEAVLGEITMATVTILDQEAAGSLILPAPPIVRLTFSKSKPICQLKENCIILIKSHTLLFIRLRSLVRIIICY